MRAPVTNGNVPASTPALDQPMPLSMLETTTVTPKLPVSAAVASSSVRREIIDRSGRPRRTMARPSLRQPGGSLDQPALFARDLLHVVEVLFDKALERRTGQVRIDLRCLLDIVLHSGVACTLFMRSI